MQRQRRLIARVLAPLVVAGALVTFASPAEAAKPIGRLELVKRLPDDANSTVRVKGWVVDPDDKQAVVQVHAYVDGTPVASRPANLTRNDVADAVPGAGPNHGFDFRLDIAGGDHRVCIFAINIGGGTNPRIGCKNVTVGVRPIGGIDAISRLIDRTETVRVRGLALDPDTTGPINVHVYADGRLMAGARANLTRAGTNATHPGYGNDHGFSVDLDLPPGGHRVCVYGINVFNGGGNPLLGCTTTVVRVDPFGRLDLFTFSASKVTAGGWVIDRDTAASTIVDVHIDGHLVSSVTADSTRTDVGDAFPGYGDLHGFTVSRSLSLPAGPHQACVYAHNLDRGSGTVLMGCRNIVV